MRPIDADVLYDKAETWYKNAPTPYRKIYRSFVDIIADAPTITPPPDDPLTLEELREMDGEPVWVERPGYGKHWALVQVWTKSSNIIYLTCSNGMVVHPQPEIDSGAKIYRRKPEEGT